ncbi:hypothetical protein [Bifidobacterium tissieri]|uniref:hypothetical protein n=1 Tax=Bifidobacterium tissieri TaxID=1630162 RepID=UPI00123B678C|nr:hypothetical protein [Bifidobacterium tissieri]KAA8829354.1 hypothetical protein EM849_11150 [Bifidobacterium tissieri]
MTDDWDVQAWESWPILNIPSGYGPAFGDLNVPASYNTTPGALAFQVNETSIAVRSTTAQHLSNGLWVSSSFGWDIP